MNSYFAAGVDVRSGPARPPEAPEPAVPAPEAGKAGTEADRQQKLRREQAIDEVLEDSFPASDPPGWTLGRRSGG